MAHRILTLGEITAGFDVILSDVWGVLHNGVSAFPDAAVALREARKAGKTVVLITNSPRPAPGVIAQLRVLGVPDEAYDRIITSGDVTRGLIAEGPKKSSCSARNAICRCWTVSMSSASARRKRSPWSAPAFSMTRRKRPRIIPKCSRASLPATCR